MPEAKSGDEVLLVGGERRKSDDVLDFLGVDRPEDGGPVKVSVELLEPVGPLGTPLRLEDRWAPFSLGGFVREKGRGRYRFRAQRPDGRWGQQKTVSLDGPALWEEAWKAEQTSPGEKGGAAAQAPPAPASGLDASMQMMLAMQQSQQQLFLGLLDTLTKRAEPPPPPDPFDAFSKMLGAVEKLRELTGDQAPAKSEGWGRLLDFAERFGEGAAEAMQRDQERKAAGEKRAPAQQQSSGSGSTNEAQEPEERKQLPSSVQEALALLKLVRGLHERGAPPLLVADVLEIQSPELAASIVEGGEAGIPALVENVARRAPELGRGVGRRWLELVARSIQASAAGEDLPREAQLDLEALAELVGEDEQDEEAPAGETDGGEESAEPEPGPRGVATPASSAPT